MSAMSGMSGQAPYYESRYIRANHPDRPQALWLRETLLLPTAGEPVADVWVMVFDPDGSGNRALKEPYPIDAASYEYDDWTARIGAATLDDRSAQGVVTGGARSARWDLRITPGTDEPVKLLTERGVQGAHPDGQDHGAAPAGAVRRSARARRRARRHRRLDRQRQPQLGAKHTPAYAFGQVCGFDNAPDSTLEIVTARAAIGPVLTPAATLFVFRHAGEEFAVRSVLHSLQTHARYRPFSWTFGGRIGDHMIEGEIAVEPEDVIGLTYTDTDGGQKYCYNSAIATCRMQLAGKAFARAELVASRRAMFEILTDTRHDAVPLLA